GVFLGEHVAHLFRHPIGVAAAGGHAFGAVVVQFVAAVPARHGGFLVAGVLTPTTPPTAGVRQDFFRRPARDSWPTSRTTASGQPQRPASTPRRPAAAPACPARPAGGPGARRRGRRGPRRRSGPARRWPGGAAEIRWQIRGD